MSHIRSRSSSSDKNEDSVKRDQRSSSRADEDNSAMRTSSHSRTRSNSPAASKLSQEANLEPGKNQVAQKGQTVEVEDQGLPEYQKVKGEHAPNPGVDLALNKDKMMMATDCMWQVSFSTNIFLSSSKELLYLTLSVFPWN